MKKATFDLPENIAGLLSYVLCWVSGIVFLVCEKENKFVRFHALQSILTFGSLSILNIILGFLRVIPLIGWIFALASGVVWIVMLVAWIWLMYTAYKGQTFKVPVVGDVAWDQINK